MQNQNKAKWFHCTKKGKNSESMGPTREGSSCFTHKSFTMFLVTLFIFGKLFPNLILTTIFALKALAILKVEIVESVPVDYRESPQSHSIHCTKAMLSLFPCSYDDKQCSLHLHVLNYVCLVLAGGGGEIDVLAAI